MAKKPEDYEWPYLISLAETPKHKEYDGVREIVRKYDKFTGDAREKCLNELSEELDAVPHKYNFNAIAKAAWTATRMDDKKLVKAAAKAKVESDLHTATMEALNSAEGVTGLHWFDAKLSIEEHAVLFKVYSLEADRRGIKGEVIVAAAAEIAEKEKALA